MSESTHEVRTRPESTAGGERPFLQIRDLRKSFDMGSEKLEVLKGLNLDIHQGEILAVLGASGVGKSTFLHILGTLEHPSGGSVLYDSEEVFDLGPRELAQFRNRQVGFVFQFHHLLPEFTAVENALMPAIISGMEKGRAAARAEALLRGLGLGNRLGHRPGELSGGEKQRVALARALIMEPKVLLADEPTGNLDTITGSVIHDLIVDLNRRTGVTVVVATHNRSLAEQTSRQVQMVDGRIYEG